MGATAAMFGPQWRERIPGAYHDWPKWAGDTSIRELAESIVERDQIQDGDQVIGTSLGGIVACEIGKVKKLDLVVLIASAERKEEIDVLLELLHPLADFAPLGFVKACAGKIPFELAEMFSESDPVFIRTMIKAIFKWEGSASDVPIFRIHGIADRVIPRPLRIDHLINGGHLIVMTHAKECIDRFTEVQSERSSSRGSGLSE